MARRKTLTINGLEIYSNANGDPSTVTKCSKEGGREGEGGDANYISKKLLQQDLCFNI